jgi:4-hydroxy-L-threonine phosphate dehydrogenase PdxA
MTIAPQERAKPVAARLLGDPSGRGPELAVNLRARSSNLARANVALLGEPKVVAERERAAGVALGVAGNGVALGVAGKGVANVEGLQQAFDLVVLMCAARAR